MKKSSKKLSALGGVLLLVPLLLWTLGCGLVQAVLLSIKGDAKQKFAQAYWAGIALLLGLRVTIRGAVTENRPVMFVANHCSWLDIVVLGKILPGCFVAKGDVATWPGIGLVAKLGRTIFVSRNRATVGRERADLEARLVAGDNIILFPEGTTSDGTRILPFSTTFLALAEAKAAPWVQPVTLVYDAIDSLPVQRRDRPNISWYGDMDLVPHYFRFRRAARVHATIILDAAMAPGTFGNRKALSAVLRTRLEGNAAALRQGR